MTLLEKQVWAVQVFLACLTGGEVKVSCRWKLKRECLR